jgi:hypothetical protein
MVYIKDMVGCHPKKINHFNNLILYLYMKRELTNGSIIMRYKLLQISLVENLIAFLDECQEEALMEGQNTDSMQLVNFCNWAIKELLNAKEGIVNESDVKSFKNKKERYDKIDEKFFDWQLPDDMSEKEFDKMLNQFDAFLRGWEKEYNKKHPDKPAPERQKPFKPHIDDIMEWCSLEEVAEYLKDDPELTDEERFELYYDERERRKPEKKGLTYNQLLKGAGIKQSKPSDKKKKK